MGVLSRMFGTATKRELAADVAEAYRAARRQADLLLVNAERARYPQAAEAMRRLAETETRHAEELRQQLHVLAADLPTVEPPVVTGNSQWQRIVSAYQAAQAKRRRLVELMTHWDPEEPEAAVLFRRLADECQRDFRGYEAIIMRSDPQAIS